MTSSRSWHLPLGATAVALAFVGAVIGVTPAASSQPDTVCASSELTASGPLIDGCERSGR